LPPGPRFAALQTWLYARDPIGHLARCQRRYGDPFTVPTTAGPVVVAATPALVREVFAADADVFVPFAPHTVELFVGRGSLLVQAGAQHREARRRISPALHGEALRARGGEIRDVAVTSARAWRPGRVFVLLDAARGVSRELIVRAVLGLRDPRRIEALGRALAAMLAAGTPALLFVPTLRRRIGGLGPFARFARAQARVHALLSAEIAARRACPEGQDVLTTLLGELDDETVRDELLTLLIAGHETTGVALAWAVYWLLRSPTALARVLAELDACDATPDALARLPYLDAVCHEALRLGPVVSDVTRTLARPLRLGGYDLPAGTSVAAATALLHTRSDLYPRPGEFRPERFLERRFGPCEHAPFGGGARRCPGAAFALYSLKIVLGTWLARHTLRLAEPGDVAPARRNLVLGPSTGVRVVGFPRASRSTDDRRSLAAAKWPTSSRLL
ncbi:MAG TPA: cytochrome P450, partial [Nannocystis sp.]